MNPVLKPEDWGLRTGSGGELLAGGFRAVDLAREFGTPLHVLMEDSLERSARRLRLSLGTCYPGRFSIHYAFKCNSLPAVVETVRRAGLKAEVMSEFELDLALRLGYRGEDIVVNGPGKSASFLKKCLESGVRLINVDSLEELTQLDLAAGACGRKADVLLRLNPDFVPRGMNRGTATGSRKGCAFGLDLRAGEASLALAMLPGLSRVRFRGYHFHIGTGITDPRAYSRTLEGLRPLFKETKAAGFSLDIVNVGGGFASPTARELSTRQFLVYQGLERLPAGPVPDACPTFDDFNREICGALRAAFPSNGLPELLLEPGRCIASPNQFLLLTVHEVKSRPRIRKWLITDGGLGTVSLPTFYEYHEVFLADDVRRPRTEKVTIIGPVCFASDIVYRNKRMPAIRPGEVLAVMDSGAYFLAQESSFGFPRSAVVAVSGESCRLARRRDTFSDMVGRDQCAALNLDEQGG